MCARGGKKLGKRRSVLTKSPRNRTTKPMKLQMRYLGEASSCCLYQLYLLQLIGYRMVSSVSSGSEMFWAYYRLTRQLQYAASPCSVYFSNRGIWNVADMDYALSWPVQKLGATIRYVWKAQLTDIGTNFLTIVIVFALTPCFCQYCFFCFA